MGVGLFLLACLRGESTGAHALRVSGGADDRRRAPGHFSHGPLCGCGVGALGWFGGRVVAVLAVVVVLSASRPL